VTLTELQFRRRIRSIGAGRVAVPEVPSEREMVYRAGGLTLVLRRWRVAGEMGCDRSGSDGRCRTVGELDTESSGELARDTVGATKPRGTRHTIGDCLRLALRCNSQTQTGSKMVRAGTSDTGYLANLLPTGWN
jgi:hypothetical protein